MLGNPSLKFVYFQGFLYTIYVMVTIKKIRYLVLKNWLIFWNESRSVPDHIENLMFSRSLNLDF